MFRILVVEDSSEVYERLCELLDDAGYDTDVATGQRDAVRLLESEDKAFDLALVDLQLGDGHGFSIFSVAHKKNVPVIFLTATNDEYTVSGGLDMGAYDYIPKPYRPQELLSRIRTALRNSGKLQTEITCREIRADLSKGKVYKNGEELELTRFEYRLLLYFMNNLGRVLTRDQLQEEIWNISGDYITDNALSAQIKRVRKAIGDDPKEPQYIETVRGIGYKMEK